MSTYEKILIDNQTPIELKLKRFFLGYSQFQLGFRSGMSQGKISNLERGYRKPTQKDIEKLARALDCQPEDIRFPKFEGESD